MPFISPAPSQLNYLFGRLTCGSLLMCLAWTAVGIVTNTTWRGWTPTAQVRVLELSEARYYYVCATYYGHQYIYKYC